MAKKINEILKTLNFPKFYSKTRDGGFNFNPSETYTDVDLITLLNSLPYTEDTIHNEDLDFIIEYLEYCKCIDSTMIDSYLLKLIDNRGLDKETDYPIADSCGCDSSPKVDEIIRTFSKKARKLIFTAIFK